MVELIVTLAVIAILAGISAPYFGDIIRANQITRYTNDLVAVAYAARLEAIKRTVNIRVSALDPDAGGSNNEWGHGLRVWLDGDPDDADVVFDYPIDLANPLPDEDVEIRLISAVEGNLKIDECLGITDFNFTPNGTIVDTSTPPASITVVLQLYDNEIIDERIIELIDKNSRSVTITPRGLVRAAASEPCP